MRLDVHLHTILQKQTPSGLQRRLAYDLPVGARLADLAAALGLDAESDSILLVVNGRTARPEQVLHAGDQVHFIPAISGGWNPPIADIFRPIPA